MKRYELKLKNNTLIFSKILNVVKNESIGRYGITVMHDNKISNLNYTSRDYKYFERDYNCLCKLISTKKDGETSENDDQSDTGA